MATNVDAQICVRRDTAANWAASSTILLNGEVAYDTTNNKIKIGNGSSLWSALPYLTDATGGGGYPDPNNKAIYVCDFLESAVPIFTSSQGSGQSVPYGQGGWGSAYAFPDAGTEVHPGMIVLVCASANGYCIVGPGISPTGWDLSNQRITNMLVNDYALRYIVSPYAFLSTNTNRFSLYAGVSSQVSLSTAQPPEDGRGAFFRYTHDVNGGRWQCAYYVYDTDTASIVKYYIDSGITVTVDWFNLKIEILNTTTAGSRPVIKWYVNDVEVASIDMNTLPANITWLAGPYVSMSSVATGSPISMGAGMYVDYMDIVTTLNRLPSAIGNVES